MTIRSAEVVQCMLIGNVLDLTPAAGNPIDRHFYTVASEIGCNFGARFLPIFRRGGSY